MIDRVLGRAALKERIEELETKRSSLEAQLEAAEDRRREAVSARQKADRRVNTLEDRITELEDRVERAEADSPSAEFRGRTTVGGDRLDAVLDTLESLRTRPEAALSAMVGTTVSQAVRDHFGERAPLLERAAPALVYADEEQLLAVALRPPIAPEPFVRWDDRFRLRREWFEPPEPYAVALVRSDLFAMGEYVGRERQSFTGLRSDVKGDHSKGGFSQARFERRRDDQIDDHLEAAMAAIEDRGPDTLYVLGESTLLPDFAEEAAVTAPSDATGKPEPALEAAVEDFFTVQLSLL